jgi:hypothetical protein
MSSNTPVSNTELLLTQAEQKLLASRWAALYPSTQADILSAVQVLPAKRQARATYDMALRSPTMAELFDEI